MSHKNPGSDGSFVSDTRRWAVVAAFRETVGGVRGRAETRGRRGGEGLRDDGGSTAAASNHILASGSTSGSSSWNSSSGSRSGPSGCDDGDDNDDEREEGSSSLSEEGDGGRGDIQEGQAAEAEAGAMLPGDNINNKSDKAAGDFADALISEVDPDQVGAEAGPFDGGE